jgi:erythronate-4-phosphate dehydrogenase
MNICVDENIPFGSEAFGTFGDVLVVPGREITPEVVADCSMLMVRSVTRVGAELLENSTATFVATATIGIDHIDTEYLKEHTIGFAYAPGSNACSVAEYVVAALCHCAEKKGFDLSEKTLGIIGVGNVGSRVLRRAQALGMTCLCNDPPKKRLTGSSMFLSLQDVLRDSDIITVHVPLQKGGEYPTYHLVNDTFLTSMKKGAIVINTSRGKVLDETALKSRFDLLGGLVLDVWHDEPVVNPDILARADIATPHIAGYSWDGKVNATQMIYDAACAYHFISPSWNSAPLLEKEHPKPLDLRSSKQIVYDAVRGAYPIMRDSDSLKAILKKPEQERESCFDMLRKKYPKRLEFNHYRVKCKKSISSSTHTLLTDLGFTVDFEK